MKNKIRLLIKKYAEVYKGFEELQSGNGLLASGDQKTGVIAEYYAKRFIEHVTKDSKSVAYAKSGASFDIIYRSKVGKLVKVQVKGVSAHSRSRVIAPLNLKDKNGKKAFDELFLIALDSDFLPKEFYINKYADILQRLDPKRDRIVGSKMKGSNASGGSSIYDFSKDRISALLEALR
jgi:hypothetical protein